jgi:hypothetical protein
MSTPELNVWSIEPHLCDADRLVAAILELHVQRIAGVDLELTADQHEFMIEVLLDRLRVEIGKAKDMFYTASGDRCPHA